MHRLLFSFNLNPNMKYVIQYSNNKTLINIYIVNVKYTNGTVLLSFLFKIPYIKICVYLIYIKVFVNNVTVVLFTE